MGANTVIPGSATAAEYIRMPSAQTAGQEFKAKQLATLALTEGAVKKTVDNDAGELVGISTKDEQDSFVEVYIGPIIKIARAAGSTIPLLEEVYADITGVAPNEVSKAQGPLDATGNATSFGYAIRVTTNWVLVRTIWLTDRPPAASPS